MQLVPLDESLVDIVEPWFDDPVTARVLGGGDIRSDLTLMRAAPGTVFRDLLITARHIWVVYENEVPVAYLDVEIYSDGSAGLSFAVAPPHRGRGVATRLLLQLDTIPELSPVKSYVGGVSPKNAASRRCLEKAGFMVGPDVDDEGMYPLRRSCVKAAP